MVRRRFFHDELVGEDGAALVLVGGTLVHVEEVGVCVLALADDWITEDEITRRLVTQFGLERDLATDGTHGYVVSLVEGGLLEAKEAGEPRHPPQSGIAEPEAKIVQNQANRNRPR